MRFHIQNRLLLCLSATALAFVVLNARHPYYLSVCEVDHNAQTKTLEISFKIFTDDLEAALKAQSAEALSLGTKQESISADRHIYSYLKSHVVFVVNGDTVACTYVGKEVEMEVTWCYIEAKGVPAIEQIEVMNRLLLEQHQEQANIVHVKAGNVRKSLLLHKNKTNGLLAFP